MTELAVTAAERRAQDAAVTALLNCYLREVAPEPPLPAAGGPARLRLARLGLELAAELAYRSPTGRHAWRLPVRLVTPAGTSGPLDHLALASLLASELARAGRPGAPGKLVAAVAESARNTAAFLAGTGRDGGDGQAVTPFLRAERSLALGHPLHPTPKSRAPMTFEEVRRFAPELGASFPLRWFRADRSVVAEDSALPRRATEVLAGILAQDPGVDPAVARLAAAGEPLVPVHPWQARRLVERPAVRALLEQGLLTDLGEQGAPWHPTSSVRTVYRADAPVMLKLSLEARITNSVRRNLAKELARGLEVHRLLEAGLGAELHRRYPGFRIVRDPAWVTVVTAAGGAESGFEVVLRENPYPAARATDVTCVAALCAEPAAGGPPRLARVVQGVAAAGGLGVEEAARAWFRRYLCVAIDPLLWLRHAWGVALEAHQQNSLVELDAQGWPAGARYRDNQGYYFRASQADRLRALLPSLNEASDTVCDDAVADERFGYYVLVNHVLGLVGALGVAGLADERRLLADLDRHLAAWEGCELVERWRSAPTLRCKANLLTRFEDRDELVGPLAEQSVYVDLPNPLAEARAGVGA